MSDKIQGFFFDRVRSSADNTRRLVVQGYAIDGYLDLFRPRAAIFVDGKPVRALKCTFEVVKLPPIKMRRRNGNTISYIAMIYVDMADISDKKIRGYGSSAKLVVIGEKTGELFENSIREMVYKAPLSKIAKILSTYNYSVDVAFVEDGKTVLRGWMGGSNQTVIKISDVSNKDSAEYLPYRIDFLLRDDVLMEYPECPDDARLGFEITVDGTFKKLNLAMHEGKRDYSKVVSVGKSDDEFSKANVISRYSEKVVRNLKNYGVKETMQKIKVRMSPSYVNLNRHYDKWIRKISPSASELEAQREHQKKFEYRPLLSILVPLYETDEKFLAELIQSVKVQTYPNWEMVSIGPTIVHPHSPDERVKIDTVGMCWEYLKAVLENIPCK